MAKPTTREGLKQWCLRRLGAPVIEINTDDDQLEDRIDEALEKFHEYHHEGTEKMYLKAQIRASTLTIQESNAADFPKGSIITGRTSGAKAKCVEQSDGLESEGSTILVINATRDGEFIDGEKIENNRDDTTATLALSDAVTLNEWDKKYVEVSDLVFGITRILHFTGGATSTGNLFDYQYQLRLHDLYNLSSTSMLYYTQIMQYIDLIDFTLNPKPMMNFNRMQNRLHILIDWDRDILPGDYVVAECYRALDPDEFTKTWHHPWLLEYVTELFRLQWGENLYKYNGVQLPGGVTVNAVGVIDRAERNIEKLQQKLIDEEAPLEFFLG